MPNKENGTDLSNKILRGWTAQKLATWFNSKFPSSHHVNDPDDIDEWIVALTTGKILHPDELDAQFKEHQERQEREKEESEKTEKEIKEGLIKKITAAEKEAQHRSKICSNIPDIVLRAEALKEAELFAWADTAWDKKAETWIIDSKSDANLALFFNYLFDFGSGSCSHPYFDTFRGLPIAHTGEILKEKRRYNGVEELDKALRKIPVRKVPFNKIDTEYKAFAFKHRRNSLKDRFYKMLPTNGNPELIDTKLIKLFNLVDNPTNRLVSRYFWFSLYSRITKPGSQAPIAIALIGDQMVGKTFFSLSICREIIGDDTAAPVTLNFEEISRNPVPWLRRITGHSIIANIGEFQGYDKGDMEVIKEFMTRPSDTFDRKFFDDEDVPRSWIVVADGNSYSGFQRDDSGNRRFFPMFVNAYRGDKGELVYDGGQPSWPKDGKWRADFTGFADDLWSIMAECHKIVSADPNYYGELVDQTSIAVREFNAEEMKSGRGILGEGSAIDVLDTIIAAPWQVYEAAGVKTRCYAQFRPVTNISRDIMKSKFTKGDVERHFARVGITKGLIKGVGNCWVGNFDSPEDMMIKAAEVLASMELTPETLRQRREDLRLELNGEGF